MQADIRKAYDMGVSLFDTAEAYGPFTNEELVGEAIAPFRKDMTLCSKFGFDIQNGKMLVLSSRASSFTRCLLNEADGRQAGPPSLGIGVRAATKPECFYFLGAWLHVNPIDTNTWRAQKAELLRHRWIGYFHFAHK